MMNKSGATSSERGRLTLILICILRYFKEVRGVKERESFVRWKEKGGVSALAR